MNGDGVGRPSALIYDGASFVAGTDRSLALSSTPPADLNGLNMPDLRRAVALYLAQAYPAVEPPLAVQRRLDWPAEAEPKSLISGLPFERGNKPGSPAIHALRLGNVRYPHMKLQIQPWPCSAGYMLSVNTHDQFVAFDPNAPDAEAFRALQSENARIKEAIELAWDAAGLPTFLRYLRDYLEEHPSGV